MNYSGPLWLGGIIDKQFCESMVKENAHKPFRNSRKIAKLLFVATTEVDAPITYYVLETVGKRLALPVPAVNVLLKILRDNNFQAYPTHFNSRGIRTDAPALTVQNFLQKIATGR